ncbi:MAG: hypothetical protein Ta2A_02340 [Treponemataceae bacterium]|nr:MAG: hypothetical protein Ta2A_02340 [Treponemataceae bacterium]
MEHSIVYLLSAVIMIYLFYRNMPVYRLFLLEIFLNGIMQSDNIR